jgi:hypothetical protein
MNTATVIQIMDFEEPAGVDDNCGNKNCGKNY